MFTCLLLLYASCLLVDLVWLICIWFVLLTLLGLGWGGVGTFGCRVMWVVCLVGFVLRVVCAYDWLVVYDLAWILLINSYWKIM